MDEKKNNNQSEEVVDMDTTIKKPSCILESIDDSFKQIKDFKEGKTKFLSLKDAKENWKSQYLEFFCSLKKDAVD